MIGQTRRDYRCSGCQKIFEVEAGLGEDLDHVRCPDCGEFCARYFGSFHDMLINYGFRPDRYPTKEEERIGQYQFENL